MRSRTAFTNIANTRALRGILGEMMTGARYTARKASDGLWEVFDRVDEVAVDAFETRSLAREEAERLNSGGSLSRPDETTEETSMPEIPGTYDYPHVTDGDLDKLAAAARGEAARLNDGGPLPGADAPSTDNPTGEAGAPVTVSPAAEPNTVPPLLADDGDPVEPDEADDDRGLIDDLAFLTELSAGEPVTVTVLGRPREPQAEPLFVPSDDDGGEWLPAGGNANLAELAEIATTPAARAYWAAKYRDTIPRAA